jgi:hypothetical protein
VPRAQHWRPTPEEALPHGFRHQDLQGTPAGMGALGSSITRLCAPDPDLYESSSPGSCLACSCLAQEPEVPRADLSSSSNVTMASSASSSRFRDDTERALRLPARHIMILPMLLPMAGAAPHVRHRVGIRNEGAHGQRVPWSPRFGGALPAPPQSGARVQLQPAAGRASRQMRRGEAGICCRRKATCSGR